MKNKPDFLEAFEKARAQVPYKNIAKKMLMGTTLWSRFNLGMIIGSLRFVTCIKLISIYFHFEFGSKAEQDASTYLDEWEVNQGGATLENAIKRSVIFMFFQVYHENGMEAAKQWLNS